MSTEYNEEKGLGTKDVLSPASKASHHQPMTYLPCSVNLELTLLGQLLGVVRDSWMFLSVSRAITKLDS